MATFQPFRNSHVKTRASVRKSFSEDVFQSVKSLLQSEKKLCSVSAEDSLKQDEHANLTEVTFLGFNEETDAAHIQDLAAVSLELPDLLNSLHFCSLNENEIICMKDINKSSDISSAPLNQSHHSEMLCVMRVSPTLPRFRIDFIFSLLSKYATGMRYTLDTYSHQKCQLETTNEDDDDTNQSVSSIEDDFVTAFEHLEEEETLKPFSDGINIATLRSQCDAAAQTVSGPHVETHDLRILVSSGRQKSLAKPSNSLTNVQGHKELPSVKTSVTTSISEPWIQKSFYRSSNASDKGSDTQKMFFSSSPAYSSESECSSPSPVIFLDEEGYQKSLKAKLELPKIPVMKDDIEDSDSEVSEFFDSFDQFDELEQTLETSCLFIKDPIIGTSSQKKGHKHGKCCMNPQKFKFDRPALPANVRKPTPRKPESPYGNPCDVPDSPRPVKATGEDSGLFSPIRSSAFSPLGGCTPAECCCLADNGGDTIHENHDSVYYTYEDYADSVSCEVLGSVLHTQHANAISNINSSKSGENKTVALKHGNLDQKSKSKNKSLMIKDSIQKFAADLVEKSFGGAFKDLQKGVSSCTNALCHLAIKLTSSVFQMAFNELRRQRAFSLKERAISGLANFLVSEALSNALKDLQYVKKQIFTNTVARFAADLAEELVFEGIMEVCQFSYPPTPASPQCGSFDFEDKVVKSYAKDLSESVIQEAFIELSQVDVTFTTKAAVSVSTDNIKYVSAASGVPSAQTVTFSPSFHSQAVTVTKPMQEHKKEYTVQQALFCTSGIVTSIPVPLAGSALLPYHISSGMYQTKSHLSSDDSNSNGDSTQAHVTTKNNEEEVACLRNICLPSEHNPGNQNDFKPTNDDGEMQSSSKLTSDPVIINNFSAAMVHTIVNETLDSMTSFEVTKTVDEQHTDYLTKSIEGKNPSSHCDQATLQRSEASNKDVFAHQLSKSIIKHSIDKSKSVIPNIDKSAAHKESLPVPGEESQLTLEKFPKFLDSQDHRTHCSLSVEKDCAPECKGSMVHEFSLETLPPFPTVVGQKPDLKELAKDKPVKKHNLKNTSLEPFSFGQESTFPHSHTFSSAVLTCVDGLHVEDKQKIRDRNVIPDTPPSTPLVPSQASSEWDIKKLTKKLKGELAKEFAPATPPSTPHNSSVGSLSENEQNTMEKEEFMLKLMRSLSEEVESSEGEEHSEVEHSGKKVQFAEELATRIISLATEMAASHLDHKIIQEPKVNRPCLNAQSQRSISPTFLNHSAENLQTLCNFAGDMAAEVITEAGKIAKVKSCMLFSQKNSFYVDGDQDYRSEENLGHRDIEALAHPREMDPFVLSLPPSSCMSGLTYKYPSCESVTDEYAGHIIQILKQEGGNSELIMDQYANRLAYRSVKSGLQEAAKTTKVKCSSKMFPVQSLQVKTNKELLMFSNKDYHQVDKKRQSKRNGGYFCKNQTCERTQDIHRNECSELCSFSTSLAHSITRDVKKELIASTVGLPKSLTDSCLYEKSVCDEDTECHVEPELPKSLQPSSQNHRFYHSTGSLNGENVVQAIEQYAKKVADDTLGLSLGSTVFQVSETTKSADRVTYAEKLSPLISQACRYCDLKELHDCTGNSSPHFFRQGSLTISKPASNSKFSTIYQKSRIFHLDVPQIHVNLDKKTVLAEKIVAEAIEKAERELSNASLAADSGIGQDGASFAESLATEIMTSAVTNVGHAASSSKQIEDFQSTESFGSQQMNLSIGDDSTGSWSNLSFEDEHQDESSSFHHLSESNGNSSSWSSLGLEGDLYEDNLSFPTSDSDGPDVDKDEEHEDDVEGLRQDGKTLLITNIDMEPCTVDPQLRIILQWLVASEAEVAELYFHDSAKKEFILLSKRLQEKGWKVGDLLQAVLQYYEVMEETANEERCKSLFDWLLENA